MSEVWIPDNPPTRSYTCPNCKKGVKCFRLGDSSSYLVMDADDEKKDHDCKGSNGKAWKGAIDNKLLGYRPPKEKKNEAHTGTDPAT